VGGIDEWRQHDGLFGKFCRAKHLQTNRQLISSRKQVIDHDLITWFTISQ
jgi:hypothetical protein